MLQGRSHGASVHSLACAPPLAGQCTHYLTQLWQSLLLFSQRGLGSQDFWPDEVPRLPRNGLGTPLGFGFWLQSNSINMLSALSYSFNKATCMLLVHLYSMHSVR